MAGSIALTNRENGVGNYRATDATTEPTIVRWLRIGLVTCFLILFLSLPLAVVLSSALEKGVAFYFATFRDPDSRAAIRLTLIAAAIAVPLNLIFGIAAAWAVAKFEFV